MFRRITILVDNNSWILPYAEQLLQTLVKLNYHCVLVRSANDIPKGDVCFLLGCTKIVPKNILLYNQYNMVIHESNLPQGKGFAPIAWQILEGKKVIPVCLIEANESVDSGDIWLKEYIELVGDELSHQWRIIQGEISIQLAIKFITNFHELKPQVQLGKSTNYPRRIPKDSELDINKTIAAQFDLLRVVDNHLYPAFFNHLGVRYKIKVYRDE